VLDKTDGRGADSVIDAVGMEAHGAPATGLVQKAAGLLPDAAARVMILRIVCLPNMCSMSVANTCSVVKFPFQD